MIESFIRSATAPPQLPPPDRGAGWSRLASMGKAECQKAARMTLKAAAAGGAKGIPHEGDGRGGLSVGGMRGKRS